MQRPKNLDRIAFLPDIQFVFMSHQGLKCRSHAELDSASQFFSCFGADPDRYRDESSSG